MDDEDAAPRLAVNIAYGGYHSVLIELVQNILFTEWRGAFTFSASLLCGIRGTDLTTQLSVILVALAWLAESQWSRWQQWQGPRRMGPRR